MPESGVFALSMTSGRYVILRTYHAIDSQPSLQFIGLKSEFGNHGHFQVLMLVQRTKLSASGTLTLRLRMLQRSCMVISTTLNFMLVFKPRKQNQSWKVQAFAQVCFVQQVHLRLLITPLIQGYTISRAILSDAIALTRGDRFFTYDFTPHNLTAWGFADCQRDPNAFGFGSTLGRLFLRTLPNNFTENSVYTFFPLMTPDSMKTNLTKLKRLDEYDLNRPQPRPQVRVVSGYGQIGEILQDNDGFAIEYAARAARVSIGKG